MKIGPFCWSYRKNKSGLFFRGSVVTHQLVKLHEVGPVKMSYNGLWKGDEHPVYAELTDIQNG